MLRTCKGALLAVALAMAAIQPLPAQSTESPVSRADIQKLLDATGKSDRLEIFDVEGLRIGRRVYASSARKDLDALRDSIRINPGDEWVMCACDPSTIIRLFRKGEKVGEVGIIEGDIISFSNWDGETRIADTTAWFQWLDERGIPRPRQELRQSRPRRRNRESPPPAG